MCVCGSGIPYVMGDRDGNIQNPCPCGDIFCFAPLRKQAYKSYRMKFFENLKMHKVFCKGYVYV